MVDTTLRKRRSGRHKFPVLRMFFFVLSAGGSLRMFVSREDFSHGRYPEQDPGRKVPHSTLKDGISFIRGS